MARPPKANPVRRNASIGVVHLPSDGYQGEVPPWPLSLNEDLDFATREEVAWERLWRTPQAAAWARMGWIRPVARYARMLVVAETPSGHAHCKECNASMGPGKMDASLLAQVTAMEDRLGLTPKAMRLMLWEVIHDEVGEAREVRAASAATRRLMAVDPTATGDS